MRQKRSLRRRAPTRSPKRKFIIYTEGRNTEPDYFRAIHQNLFGALVDIELIHAGVPLTIAEQACKRARDNKRQRGKKSSFEEGDQIWAVFDRDEHPNVEDALNRCRTNKVGIAFSDPCFELWLILHLQDFDRVDDRHQLQTALSAQCAEYDRKGSKSANFSKFVSQVKDAEARAEKQLNNRIAEGHPPRRPFTTVFKLTREMDEAHRKYAEKRLR